MAQPRGDAEEAGVGLRVPVQERRRDDDLGVREALVDDDLVGRHTNADQVERDLRAVLALPDRRHTLGERQTRLVDGLEVVTGDDHALEPLPDAQAVLVRELRVDDHFVDPIGLGARPSCNFRRASE